MTNNGRVGTDGPAGPARGGGRRCMIAKPTPTSTTRTNKLNVTLRLNPELEEVPIGSPVAETTNEKLALEAGL